MNNIPFNRPYLTGNEFHYMRQAVQNGHLSGNGTFTKQCQQYFEQHYGFGKCLLTTSCTDALEMAAILLNIEPGDEVIMPSYTFVSTANAFVLRGARIVFADSRPDHPGIDEDSIENLITERTKAIVVVHYAGVACDMDKIMDVADRYNLFVVEDAAQAIDSYYTGENREARPLGSIGHLATFSFHETKNIQSGEGGMLVINDDRFAHRAEIIWEKGTNRTAFFRGEVDKYGWVDVGSSFLPSEVTGAFLWAQLESMNSIQQKRKEHWNFYKRQLQVWAAENDITIPVLPEYSTNNAHMFYMVCRSEEHRDQIIRYLGNNGVQAVFHYQSLHRSKFYKEKHDNRELVEADRYSNCLLRLPLYYELTENNLTKIVRTLKSRVTDEVNSIT